MPTELSAEILKEPEKILLYGAPKTGKTFLSGTAPGDLYYLVIGPRNEMKTLAAPAWQDLHGGKKHINYDFVLEKMGERGQFKKAIAFDAACDILDDALELHRKGDLPIDTIIVENVSTLMEVQMNKAMELSYQTGSPSTKKALSKLRDNNIITPGDNDWMSSMSLMNQFVSWIFKLPFNVILVAHEYFVESTDRATKQKIIHAVMPHFVGKQRNDMPRLFDNVWRTTVEGGGRGMKYVLTTMGKEGGDSAPTIVAGTRVGGVLPEKLYDADLTEVISQMQEAGDDFQPVKVDFDAQRKRTVVTEG